MYLDGTKSPKEVKDMEATHIINVIGFDGEEHDEVFYNEEDFREAVARYCENGYSGRIYGHCAIVRRVKDSKKEPFALMILNFDGSLESIARYNDEEDFGFAYADYCGLGYDGVQISRYCAIAKRVEVA